MTQDVIKFAFVAGEIAPSFRGRSDLEKFDLALEEAENWFVDYRGGISTRPGQEFCDYVRSDTLPVKGAQFKFSPDIEDTYFLLFGHQYLQFMQDGAYVLQTGQSITSINKANPALLTKNSHGYSDGDWIKIYNVVGMIEIEGMTFEVFNSTTNNFRLRLPTGQNFNTGTFNTFVSGTMARVYKVTTPYDSADLEMLQVQQVRGDFIRLTHPDYPVYTLERLSHASWTLTEEVFANQVPRITSITNPGESATGVWAIGYVITAVDLDGNESFASAMAVDNTVENPAVANCSIHLNWTYTDDVQYFNIYRTRFIHTPSSTITRGTEVGYIGRSYGQNFVDNGIIPDFGTKPPKDNNPFTDGAIENITVTAKGTAYNAGSGFSVTDPNGTGFVGQIILETDATGYTGKIAGILIINRGSGYTNPSASLSGSGSGATFTFTVAPNTGNNPACSAIFQQRQLYGATANYPLTIFGSRPGRLSNFDSAEIITDGDPYSHTIDAESYSPLRHLVPSQGGCLVFTQDGVWLLSADTGVVTPLNANADPKSFGGSAILQPLKVDADLLYLEGRLDTIRMLSFNDVTQDRFYSGKDVSILANHMISEQAAVSSWGYAPSPYKQVLATREDGQVLAFTVLKEQEIYAWSRYRTKGFYEHVASVQEGRRDSMYFIVQRYINGRWTKFVERQVERKFAHIENAFCVDCGLALTPTYPAATLQLSAAEGTGITAVAGSAVFSSGDVGKVIRAGAGKALITAYTDTTHVTVNIIEGRSFDTIFGTTTPVLYQSGEWTKDTPQSTIYGLHHLEGEEVAILADGNVVTGKVVENGAIILDVEASRIMIGLGYECRLKSLPMTIQGTTVEGKRKRLPGLVLNFLDTRGIKAGTKGYDRVFALKERTNEPLGEPTEAQNGLKMLSVAPQWDRYGQIYVKQTYPLPATLIGWIPQVEVGDDSD